MARLLYTVETGGDSPALYRLASELHFQFPAFSVESITEADVVAALSVRNNSDVPDSAWEKLNGWGYGSLTLELVA